MKYSLRVRNARLDAVKDTIGPAPTLRIFSGQMPHSCDDPVGKPLAQMRLPDDWMQKAENGEASAAHWRGKAISTGDATFFRIESKHGCDIQGSVGGHLDNAELKLSTSAKLIAGHDIIIGRFSLKSGNG